MNLAFCCVCYHHYEKEHLIESMCHQCAVDRASAYGEVKSMLLSKKSGNVAIVDQSELEKLTSETAALRERVKDLCDIIKDSIDECEGMIASEKLGGNIVKEEFWKGRITALRFVEHLLTNIHSTKGSQ